MKQLIKLKSLPGVRAFPSFLKDEMCINAVIRKLEIIGEAAKNVPTQIKKRHPHIQWAEMARTRDKLIHAYSGVNNEIVWKIITENLPSVREELGKILAK